MLYGAEPDTGIGQLSDPHQNPGGASPAGACSAAFEAVAAAPLASTNVRQAARASQIRLIEAWRHRIAPASGTARWSGSSRPWGPLGRTRVRLPGHPPRQRQPEGVQGSQGVRVVQDRGAELADPDGGEAVVAGQAVALSGAPQLPVVIAGAPRAGIGDVDHAEGGRVLEQDAQRVPSLDGGPGLLTGRAERAVTRILQVEPPAGKRAGGHRERGGLRAQDGEEGVDVDPDAGLERRETVSHRGAAARDGGQGAGLPLPPDRLDPGELVLRRAPPPPVPQRADAPV